MINIGDAAGSHPGNAQRYSGDTPVTGDSSASVRQSEVVSRNRDLVRCQDLVTWAIDNGEFRGTPMYLHTVLA